MGVWGPCSSIEPSGITALTPAVIASPASVQVISPSRMLASLLFFDPHPVKVADAQGAEPAGKADVPFDGAARRLRLRPPDDENPRGLLEEDPLHVGVDRAALVPVRDPLPLDRKSTRLNS